MSAESFDSRRVSYRQQPLTSFNDLARLLHPRSMRLTLVLLLVLGGCATQPPLRGTQWHQQGGPVAVDFEVPTPQQAEQLRQRGVQLPRSSRGLEDPQAHRDFVDLRVTAVGFGLTVGGYLLYCDGLALPVLVPESHVDLGLTSATPLNSLLYPDRASALADIATRGPGPGQAEYAYYRGAGGSLVVPTVFSPATTPRIARTMLEVREHLSETVQRDLKVLLLNLAGARILQGVFSRVVRVSAEPEARPLARGEAHESETPPPREPEPRPAAPDPAPAPPAPEPGSLAPSSGLVEALQGNNPTRPVTAGPRLPQDVGVKPTAPRPLPTDRPVGMSRTQNAQVQTDIQYLEDMGATNIRVNQQQLTYSTSQRVGINRPDLQFDYKGRRYHVEYETSTAGRGPAHQLRTTSNDPDAETILLIVP